jgi:hypothetical protein
MGMRLVTLFHVYDKSIIWQASFPSANLIGWLWSHDFLECTRSKPLFMTHSLSLIYLTLQPIKLAGTVTWQLTKLGQTANLHHQLGLVWFDDIFTDKPPKTELKCRGAERTFGTQSMFTIFSQRILSQRVHPMSDYASSFFCQHLVCGAGHFHQEPMPYSFQTVVCEVFYVWQGWMHTRPEWACLTNRLWWPSRWHWGGYWKAPRRGPPAISPTCPIAATKFR